MKSQAEQLMDFIDEQKLQAYGAWKKEAEPKLTKFLKKQVDPRLKDAKDEVEMLRMELRETRKVLQNAQEEIVENEHLLELARKQDDDELSGFRTE